MILDAFLSWLAWPIIFCVGTNCFARLHRERRAPKSTFCFPSPSLTGTYLFLFSLYQLCLLLHQLCTLCIFVEKFARFLFEFHAHRFESLDLLLLPADRSDFDVHWALLDYKVHVYVILWTLIISHTLNTARYFWIHKLLNIWYRLYQLFQLMRKIDSVKSICHVSVIFCIVILAQRSALHLCGWLTLVRDQMVVVTIQSKITWNIFGSLYYYTHWTSYIYYDIFFIRYLPYFRYWSCKIQPNTRAILHLFGAGAHQVQGCAAGLL